ncbi:efflux RND transporter periplasmic adaptor subunit [Parasphingorhabdus sp. DH2-15]|uniref:efflux RND transporter periplasmic adaptor subunit n=1 Tax=Parasphingorhabdus sp. DH2-15 TaxID=3444112 RepID=UPI003F686232
MRNQLIWALGIFIAAIAIAAFMIWLRPVPDQVERIEQAPLVEATALKVSSGAIPVIVSGTVQPRDEVTIGAEVSGRLTYVSSSFREGSFVSGKTLLMRIDPADYLNQVRIARADVAAQDVAVLQAREEVAIAQDDLARYSAREEARRTSESPKAGNAAANGSATRILPPTALSKPQNNGADKPTNAKRASGLATREPQLRSAQAARERAAASLADAQLSLNRTRISAPFGGLVSAESASIGTFVQAGQALGTIVSTNAYEVRLSLTQDEASLIPGLLQGTGKNIRADVYYDYGGLIYRWTAFVDRADASLDSTTRNVEVFLRVPSPLTGGKLVEGQDGSTEGGAPPLLLGAFVEAQISGASRDSFVAVPASALRPGNEIWVVRDNKLQIVPVRVIQRSDNIAYVTAANVQQGDRLVTSSLTAPTNNMPVRLSGSDKK